MQTIAHKRANELRVRENSISLKSLLGESELNYAKFSKFRSSPQTLEISMLFEPKAGTKIYA